MAELERGQTFFDKRATNFDGQAGKFFIALSNADFGDDPIPCFVCNTEHRMDLCHLGCNGEHERYVLSPGTFSWMTAYTSVMLNKEVWYTLEEILGDDIEIRDKANDALARQIKNCIDKESISIKAMDLIVASFKL